MVTILLIKIIRYGSNQTWPKGGLAKNQPVVEKIGKTPYRLRRRSPSTERANR